MRYNISEDGSFSRQNMLTAPHNTCIVKRAWRCNDDVCGRGGGGSERFKFRKGLGLVSGN
jgi:hypothetical protein